MRFSARFRRPACRFVLCLLVLCFGAAQARADDETPLVIPSPLSATPAGTVTVPFAAIRLAGQTVTLTLTVRAKTPATLTFKGPVFQWWGESDPYPDRQFPELKITLDGQPAPTTDKSLATFAGQDITKNIAAAGQDLFAIADSPPVIFPVPGKQAAFDNLRDRHAITPLGGQNIAAWSAQRILSFPLTPGPHSLTLTYAARPASALLPHAQAAAAASPATYCLTPSALASQAARAARNGDVIITQYAIPTLQATMPATPIRLTLQNPGGKTFPATIAIVCIPTGHSILPGQAGAATQARPDASGTINILTLGSAVPP